MPSKAPHTPDHLVWRVPPLSQVQRLLSEVGLPTSDLAATPAAVHRIFLALQQTASGSEPWALGGLDLYGANALLRSIAVAPDRRRQGLATTIVAKLEERAGELGALQVFLLTTDASEFFAARGYSAITRRDLPASIRQSPQAANLCPDNAKAMSKSLSA